MKARTVALAALVLGAAAYGESTEDELPCVSDKFVACSPESESCRFDQVVGTCDNADEVVDEA
jgi:hypothetical protein